MNYSERCDALEAKERKKPPYDKWGPGAFMPPVFANTESPEEARALEFVQSRCPRAISVRVQDVVTLLVDFLKERP